MRFIHVRHTIGVGGRADETGCDASSENNDAHSVSEVRQ